jgi:hypothetical protein
MQELLAADQILTMQSLEELASLRSLVALIIGSQASEVMKFLCPFNGSPFYLPVSTSHKNTL